MSELGRRRPRIEPAIVPADPIGPLNGIQGLRTPDMGSAIVHAVREGAWRSPEPPAVQKPGTMVNEHSDDRMPRGGESAIVLDNSVDAGPGIPGLAGIDANVIIAVVRERAWDRSPEPPRTSRTETTIFEN